METCVLFFVATIVVVTNVYSAPDGSSAGYPEITKSIIKELFSTNGAGTGERTTGSIKDQ